MSRTMNKTIALSAALALLAGCGGGGSATPPSNPGRTGASTQTVTLTLQIPGEGASSSSGKRAPMYVSRNTRGIGFRFALDPHTFPATRDALASPAYYTDVTSNSASCGSPNTDGSFSCTFQVPNVPVGTVDFQIGTWDAPPAASQPVFAAAHILAANVINGVAVSSTMNTLRLTLLPVVDSVQLRSNASTLLEGTASSALLTVYPKDAQGNLIIGSDQFVDNGGNALTLNVNVTDPANVVSLGTTSFSSAAQLQSTLTYNGGSETAACGCVSFSVVPSRTIAGAAYGATIPFTSTGGGVGVPGVPQVSLSAAQPHNYLSLALGPDGNLWAAAPNGAAISSFSATGPPVHLADAGSLSSIPYAVTAGTDGDVWYVGLVGGNFDVGKFSPNLSGPVTRVQFSGNGADIIAGPDGNMYVSDWIGNNLDVVKPNSMAPSSYAAPVSGGQIRRLAAMPPLNGRHAMVCFNEGATSWIGCFDTATKSFLPPLDTGEYVNDVAAAPDGLLYAGTQSNHILAFTVGNSAMRLSKTYLTDGQPYFLAVGPDGNIWFTEPVDVAQKFGRLTIPAPGGTGVVNDYLASTGLPANADPFSIVNGKNGKLYFSDIQNGQIDEVTP